MKTTWQTTPIELWTSRHMYDYINAHQRRKYRTLEKLSVMVEAHRQSPSWNVRFRTVWYQWHRAHMSECVRKVITSIKHSPHY